LGNINGKPLVGHYW